jgi:hypothetical protein
MLITSILVLGINSAYRQARLIGTNVESTRPVYHNARIIVETLRQELSCLYFPQLSEEEPNYPFNLSILSDGTTELSFYTLMSSWARSPQSSPIVKVRYNFSKDTDTGQYMLTRTEQLCSGEKIIGKESSDVVLIGVCQLKFWVLEPNSEACEDSWKQSYNSKDTPPRALKILLKWSQTKDVPEIDFQTSILIPCQQISALNP